MASSMWEQRQNDVGEQKERSDRFHCSALYANGALPKGVQFGVGPRCPKAVFLWFHL